MKKILKIVFYLLLLIATIGVIGSGEKDFTPIITIYVVYLILSFLYKKTSKFIEANKVKNIEELKRKYKDEGIVNAILNKTPLFNMSEEMIIDMLGRPYDVVRTTKKTKNSIKTTTLFKYYPRYSASYYMRTSYFSKPKNYGLIITFIDGKLDTYKQQ